VVDSVLDVLHVVVRHRHANITQLVNHLFLGVLTAVPDSVVDAIQLFAEGLFCLFAVDLGELLHFELVFTHQVLLFLGQIAQVVSR